MEETTERGRSINPDLPRLIFMGTPDFAVPSLRKLVETGSDIPLVVTQPDRPSGRGKKTRPSPVKVLADALHIPVYQPERMRGEGVVERVRAYGAECAVVVAYGQILPRVFLDAFPLGTLNVHASLLPRHRGAAPIHRAILGGDDSTGVTIMLLDEGMDTGPMLSKREIPIGEDDTLGTMHDKLARLGADLLSETLREWKAGIVKPRPQDDRSATYAPPIRKEELRLAWHLPAKRIVDAIRAFDPVPGAHAFYEGRRMKCFKASLLGWEGKGEAGEVAGGTDKGLVVLGGDGRALSIGELQLEGQKRISAPDFLRGHPIPAGSRLQ
jgi:methionyl-tRNA formyltransferase